MQFKLERGVSFVEFALGSIVFFLLLFGCIYISILLATNIIVSRSLDAALETLIADKRFLEDTHMLSGGEYEAAWARVNTARADAIERAVKLIEASWVNKMLINYKISPPVGTAVESTIQVLRPGDSIGGSSRIYTDKWIEVGGSDEVTYYYNEGVNCKLSLRTKFVNIAPNCPLMAHAIVKFNLWPFGEIKFPVTSFQFAEQASPPITPRSQPTIPNVATPTFTATPTPDIWPTSTPTTTPGSTPTPSPTATRVPPPPNCVYEDQGKAQEACCEDCTHYSACYAECLTNPITYRCTGRCEGG